MIRKAPEKAKTLPPRSRRHGRSLYMLSEEIYMGVLGTEEQVVSQNSHGIDDIDGKSMLLTYPSEIILIVRGSTTDKSPFQPSLDVVFPYTLVDGETPHHAPGFIIMTSLYLNKSVYMLENDAPPA